MKTKKVYAPGRSRRGPHGIARHRAPMPVFEVAQGGVEQTQGAILNTALRPGYHSQIEAFNILLVDDDAIQRELQREVLSALDVCFNAAVSTKPAA